MCYLTLGYDSDLWYFNAFLVEPSVMTLNSKNGKSCLIPLRAPKIQTAVRVKSVNCKIESGVAQQHPEEFQSAEWHLIGWHLESHLAEWQLKNDS